MRFKIEYTITYTYICSYRINECVSSKQSAFLEALAKGVRLCSCNRVNMWKN